MVFRLRIDVYDRLVLLRDAHAKCSIALLPLKSRLDVFIEPFGGAAFQELHGLRQRHSCGKRKKNVNVVVRATDRDGFEAVSARNAAEERPEAVSNLFVDYGQSFFGGKHDVHELRDIRMRHKVFSRPYGTSSLLCGPALKTPGYWHLSLRDIQEPM